MCPGLLSLHPLAAPPLFWEQLVLCSTPTTWKLKVPRRPLESLLLCSALSCSAWLRMET